MDAQLNRRTNLITYSINNNTINGNYEPNLLVLLLQIINVLPIPGHPFVWLLYHWLNGSVFIEGFHIESKGYLYITIGLQRGLN